MRRVALVLALVALSFIAGCEVARAAAPWRPTSAMRDEAVRIADAHWGGEPCGGQVDESWTHLGDNDHGDRHNATSAWTPVDEADPSTYTACTVAYSYDALWDWPKYCTIVMHERGHLMGHGHADFKWDVMYPYYEAPAVECARPQPWYRPPTRPRRARRARGDRFSL